ncbi:hypothetical protein Taro_008523 [Colocasia esculenta]|uniref:CCHC-type domain-containing protein n=1 Tax=Colocasia esculenta TaxID=4460 RepID=A0A843TXF4_COLES|nr:hypothetical protein [Colocasia esculenta]
MVKNSRKIPKTKLQSIGLGLHVIKLLHNSAYTRECNKPGHMKGECPENKKEKYKKIHKFKKPKAMVATWSDEDSSEKEEEKASSSESEEICFMANSSDGKEGSFAFGHEYSTVEVQAKDFDGTLKNLDERIEDGTHNSSKGSVDTPHTGVDTMLQALRQKKKKWSNSVDTRSSSVDTRPSSQ